MRRADRLNPFPAALAALALVVPLALVGLASPASAAPGDLARTGTASASQSQSDADGTFPPDAAIDGDPTTRWASGNGPDEDVPFTQWLQVDLGAVASVDHVVLAWEAAFAAGYDVQVATTAPDDPTSWTSVHTETAGDGGTDDVTFTATDARYVRVLMTQRTSFTWDPARLHWYGYSVFSLEVYGTPTQVAVAFAGAGTTVPAGTDAVVPVILATAAASDTTVRVRSTGGSGEAGTDYTAVDQVLTFPAGTTQADVAVPTVDHGPLGQVRTVELTLSEPSAGLVLGGRTTSTVTITPHGDLPDVGAVTVLDDYESGVPAGYTTWGISAPVTPVLSTAPVDRGGSGLVATVSGGPAPGDWFGFTHDTAVTDWSAHDGFTFWFLGTGGGGLLRYELKSHGQLFERSVTDDTAGWRQVSVAFSQLRLKGDPASDARFDPSASTGFAVTLTDLGAGRVDLRRPRAVRPGHDDRGRRG